MKQNSFLDDTHVKDEEIVNESNEQTQETLLGSLSPGQMKQVLKDVSDGILNEVKVLSHLLCRDLVKMLHSLKTIPKLNHIPFTD